MVKTVSKFIRYSTIITLLGILGACSGNPALENRLAADPNLQTNPIPENSPNNQQLPANFPAEIPRYTHELSCDRPDFCKQARTIPTTKAASKPSRRVIIKVGKAELRFIS